MPDSLREKLKPRSHGIFELSASETGAPITVVGNEHVLNTFGDLCLQQAVNARLAPGVTDLVLNPDAHPGYGAPVGCVLSSPTHIYPGPVGVDIKCSMSLLQTDVDREEIADERVRRSLIKAICQRIPTGPGKGAKDVPKSRRLDLRTGFEIAVDGASKNVLRKLGIPANWAKRCEDAQHFAPDGAEQDLEERLEQLLSGNSLRRFPLHVGQLGSYGGGNHFGECEEVCLSPAPEAGEVAREFGLQDHKIAFLSHCGSRGFGHTLASHQFKTLQKQFKKSRRPFPANEPHLVFAEIGSEEAERYLLDMALAANFATVNHLLINQLVLEAFQQVLPGTQGELIYFISHNIARHERTPDGELSWVHRKGATRAFPKGHFELERTPFANTGHPILLPGNPVAGSSVMVALPGARATAYSINHGAGRALSRRAAKHKLDQSQIDRSLREQDILSNCARYPRDEAPAAYKDFEEVLSSVELAGLAQEVARLKARFVIKDSSDPDD